MMQKHATLPKLMPVDSLNGNTLIQHSAWGVPAASPVSLSWLARLHSQYHKEKKDAERSQNVCMCMGVLYAPAHLFILPASLFQWYAGTPPHQSC